MVDVIARGLAANGAARIVVVVLNGVAREAAERHHASPVAAGALGRGAAAALLLATLTKDDERVTLQVLGDGPLGGLTVDASASGDVRAFVREPSVGPVTAPGTVMFDVTDADAEGVAGGGARGRRPQLGAWVGRNGVVSVVRDLGPRDRFTGEVPIATGEVDDDVEVYLRDSEQIDSALGCEVLLDELGNVVAAAGVLVQALPHSDGSEVVAAARDRLNAGAIADILAAASDDPDAITTFELAGAVLGDDSGTLQLLDQRPVRFHCPCSRERATSMLELLGDEDLSDMIRDEGRAEVTCNFCRRQYEFSESELESVRRRLRATETPPN